MGVKGRIIESYIDEDGTRVITRFELQEVSMPWDAKAYHREYMRKWRKTNAQRLKAERAKAEHLHDPCDLLEAKLRAEIRRLGGNPDLIH